MSLLTQSTGLVKKESRVDVGTNESISVQMSQRFRTFIAKLLQIGDDLYFFPLAMNIVEDEFLTGFTNGENTASDRCRHGRKAATWLITYSKSAREKNLPLVDALPTVKRAIIMV